MYLYLVQGISISHVLFFENTDLCYFFKQIEKKIIEFFRAHYTLLKQEQMLVNQKELSL